MAHINRKSINKPLSLFMELPVRNDIIDIETDDPLNNLDSHFVTTTCTDIWKSSHSPETVILKSDIDKVINKKPYLELKDDSKESFEVTKDLDVIKNNKIEITKEEPETLKEVKALKEGCEIIQNQTENIEKEIKTKTILKVNKKRGIIPYCCLCEKKFKSKKLFLNHGKALHFSKESKGFKCLKCTKIFKHFNKLCLHTSKNHESNLPPTVKNGKPQENDNKKLYKTSLCHICGKVFNFVGQYREHLLKHNNIRNYDCKVCQKSFISKRLLTVHEKIHDSMEDRKFICGFIFDSNMESTETTSSKKSNTIIPSMQYITYNEHGEKVCNFACVSKSDLTKHRSIHLNLKPFQCHICNTSFRQSSHLRRHIKRHSGKKDYICEVCKMGFVTKDNLNNHLRTHSGVLPFICEVCGKTLLQRSQCLKHVAKCNTNSKIASTTSQFNLPKSSYPTDTINGGLQSSNFLQNDYLLEKLFREKGIDNQ